MCKPVLCPQCGHEFTPERVIKSGAWTPEEDEFTEEPTTGNKKPLPKPGERFTYNGIEFVALGEEQGGMLAVMAEPPEDEMEFDESNCNDWRKSTLRKFLNGEYIKNFNRGDLLPFVSDLIADDGMKDYGTCEDSIALLSCDLYRKYREFMPKYNNWVWTLTPWTCNPSHAYYVRGVYASGSVDDYYATHANGVAAACIFNLSIFE